MLKGGKNHYIPSRFKCREAKTWSSISRSCFTLGTTCEYSWSSVLSEFGEGKLEERSFGGEYVYLLAQSSSARAVSRTRTGLPQNRCSILGRGEKEEFSL